MSVVRIRWATLSRPFVLGLAVLVGMAAPAWSHGRATDHAGSPDGISIPSLSHGQMAVMARHRSAILDLAAQQVPTDPVMRRLDGYISLQSFACAWGLVPGSITDETSPFNECSHAGLAALRALLLHLQTMPGNRENVRALVQTIEREMLQSGASLILCRYSDEPFNTSEVIGPRWTSMPSDLPTLLVSACLLVPPAWFGLAKLRGGPEAASTTSTST